jgi:hypothetical protein
MKPDQQAKLCIVARLGRIAITLVEPIPGGTHKRTVRATLTESLRTAVCAAVAAGNYRAAVDAVCGAAEMEVAR